MAGLVATLLNADGPEYAGGQKVERYSISNGAPTVAAGAGTGSGGTMTVNSEATDSAGRVTITTGTGLPGGGGTLGVVTFANTMSGTVSPVITPGNANAAGLIAGTSSPWVIASTTNFSILSGSATVSIPYIFDYYVPDAKVSFALTTRWCKDAPQAIGEGIRIASQSFSNGTATLGLRPDFTDGRLSIKSRS